MPDAVAVILAAGQSKRMKSDTPKVLHHACGRPIIEHVLDAARKAGVTRIVVVVGHMSETVRAALEHRSDLDFALQAEQKGTGHAVKMCREQLSDHEGPVVILAGDTPLIRSKSIKALLDTQERERAACVVGTAVTEANEGLGRIVRDDAGEFVRIVEQEDASPEEQRITEINTGCFAFDSRALFAALDDVRADNTQQEEYLTDCAEILRKVGKRVVALCAFDINEAMGVNTPEQLDQIEQAMQSRPI